MNRWFFFGVNGLHQINLDFERPNTHGANVFVDVFAFTFKRAGDFQAKHIDPQFFERVFIGPAYGDLLNAKHFEGTLKLNCARRHASNSTITWSTVRDSP